MSHFPGRLHKFLLRERKITLSTKERFIKLKMSDMPLQFSLALANVNVRLIILDRYNQFITHSNNFLVYKTHIPRISVCLLLGSSRVWNFFFSWRHSSNLLTSFVCMHCQNRGVIEYNWGFNLQVYRNKDFVTRTLTLFPRPPVVFPPVNENQAYVQYFQPVCRRPFPS